MTTAPQLAWRALGGPAPQGKTGGQYRFEKVAEGSVCATCATPIEEGVPFTPPRGVKGVDNPTFHGYAEYVRFGTHVCAACAWFYGDPKRTGRGLLVLGGEAFWPLLGQAGKAPGDRPRWRGLLGRVGRSPPATPMTGVMTVDPKVRLWPRMLIATAGAPALYLHSPGHNWSRWTPFDLEATGEALTLCDRAIALGATRSAVWRGLLIQPTLADKAGLDTVLALDAALAPRRGTAELLIACLVA